MGKSLRVDAVVCAVVSGVLVTGFYGGVIENRQNRHRLSKSPDSFPSAEGKTGIRYRDGSDLANHLNLSLAPPASLGRNIRSAEEEGLEEIGDTVKSLISQLIPGAGDSGRPGKLFDQLGRGIQSRRESELSQAGIPYDKNSLYKTPLGFPCDPRQHPLICTADGASTSTSTLLPFKLRKAEAAAKREAKKKEEEDAEMTDASTFLVEKVRKLRRQHHHSPR